MKPVTVIGAGFSGLTIAHYLRENGCEVTIIEKQLQTGGLIHSRSTPHGLVETAANGLLRDENVDLLFAKLGIHFAKPNPLRRKRFIYWQKPRRWPLSIATSLKAAAFLWRLKKRSPECAPREFETVAEWAKRNVNEEFLNHLLAPALQGVYAGDAERLSAKLVLSSMFKGKRGPTVAPEGGMGELIDKLTQNLKSRGVKFQSQSAELSVAPSHATVIATNVREAAALLRNLDLVNSQRLASVEMMPLLSVTRFYEHSDRELNGFGCLFPKQQGFHALGVLFNNCIFNGRSALRSETWILGGALNKELAEASDQQILQKIDEDRQRLTGVNSEPASSHVTRWPTALPHVTTEWEATLKELNVKPPLYLHGNYLGVLGLGGILERSKNLAKEIADA